MRKLSKLETIGSKAKIIDFAEAKPQNLWHPSNLFYAVTVTLILLLLLSVSVLSSDKLVYIAFIGIFFSLLFRAPHLVVTWWMSYFNQPLVDAYGKNEYRRIFVRNGLSVFFISFFAFGSLAFYVEPIWGIFLVIFLTATNPVTFHHTYSQDRGLLTLMSQPGIDTTQLINIFLKVVVPLFILIEFIFLNNVLLMKTVLGYSLIDFSGLFFTSLIYAAISLSVVTISLSAFYSFKNCNRHFYLGLFGGHYTSKALLLSGYPGLGSTIFESLRHNFIYTNLVYTYFKNRRLDQSLTHGKPQLESLLVNSSWIFWSLTILLSLIFSIFSWQILVIMPDSLFEALGINNKFWADFSLPFLFLSYGTTGGVIIHHFYVDRYLWRFRNESLRSRLLPILLQQNEKI